MLGGLTLGGDGAGDFPARRGCPNLHHRTGRDEASHPSAKASRRRKVKRQRMARSARHARFEGSVQRKGVLPGKIFAPCVPERRFVGLFGCMARISCQNQLISDAWRANLAANWRFSRPRPLLGCMERKTCHGLTPGNAFREHFAIVERLGTHQGIILPRPDARAERSARPCAAAPQRHALQHRVAMHHDAMRRTRRFCRR
jgi:hypothetical protein